MLRLPLIGAFVAGSMLLSFGEGREVGDFGLAGRAAFASCGLEVCPAPSWDGDEPPTRWELSGLARFTTFEIGTKAGHYFESIARLDWSGLRDARFGVLVPVVALFPDGEDEMALGLANIALYGQWDRTLSENLKLRLGAQVEFPTGTDSRLASDHTEALPYVGLSIEAGRHRVQGEVGARFALGSGHSHETTTAVAEQGLLVVNPHGDLEFVYQVIADTAVGQQLRIGVLGRGQQAVGDDSETLLSAGGQLSWAPSSAVTISATAELPLIRPARFETRLSFQAALTF